MKDHRLPKPKVKPRPKPENRAYIKPNEPYPQTLHSEMPEDDKVLCYRLIARSLLLSNLTTDPEKLSEIGAIALILAEALKSGKKIYACGNGGSMACASHFCEELTGKFDKIRPPLGAMAISDAAHITCVGNDFHFNNISSRFVGAFGSAGDILLVFSTSGNSQNLITAAHYANELRMTVIGLLGKGGGEVAKSCEFWFNAPGDNSAYIQEMHLIILHEWVRMIEEFME